jgi:hypothetical protein
VGLSMQQSAAARAAGRFPAPPENEHWALRTDPAGAVERAMWTIPDPRDVELWNIEITTLGVGALVRMGWLTKLGHSNWRLSVGLPLLMHDASGALIVRVTPPLAPPAPPPPGPPALMPP